MQMKLYNEGDKHSEYFKLSMKEQFDLGRFNFLLTNSRSISGYRIIDNDLLIRLYNGSMYLFVDCAAWAVRKLGSTHQRGLIGLMIRKGFRYEFVGVLKLGFETNETDVDLLYWYVPENMIEKTKNKDKYENDLIVKTIKFYGPSDESVTNFQFDLYLNIDDSIDENSNGLFSDYTFYLGKVKILEIVQADWANWIIVNVEINNETFTGIQNSRKIFGEEIKTIFQNPVKI